MSCNITPAGTSGRGERKTLIWGASRGGKGEAELRLEDKMAEGLMSQGAAVETSHELDGGERSEVMQKEAGRESSERSRRVQLRGSGSRRHLLHRDMTFGLRQRKKTSLFSTSRSTRLSVNQVSDFVPCQEG